MFLSRRPPKWITEQNIFTGNGKGKKLQNFCPHSLILKVVVAQNQKYSPQTLFEVAL